MGTNYYYKHPLLEQAEDGEEFRPGQLHIGKSSAGWVFALHVYPERGINDLNDWEELFRLKESQIVNEYGGVVEPREMYQRITMRAWKSNPPKGFDFAGNKAILGPDNLIRSKLDSRCIKHGRGTWECFIGEFS